MTISIENTEPRSKFQLDPLSFVRQRLLTGILVALSIIGLPTAIIACIEANKLGQTGGMLLYGMLYLLVAATTLFSRKLSFNLCAGVMLGSLYLISIFNLLYFSFAGAGIELGITISVLATVLFGTRNGAITATIFLVSLLAVGSGFISGVLDVSPNMPTTTTQTVSWVAAAAAFTLLSGALVFSSGMLQRHLIHALSYLKSNFEKLEKANADLTLQIKSRRETEVKLVQSEKQFKTLFELAPDAMYLNDLEGRFLDANKTAEVLIGSPKERFIGKNIFEAGILPENEIPKALRILEKNIQGEGTGPDEFTLVNADGNTVVVEILTSPFQLGGRSEILGIARDVSERKRLENQLYQALKMESIGNLAGGIAHDFNNILFPIVGMSEMLLEDLPPGSPEHESIQQIFKAGMRGSDLVKQILAFSRQTEHQMMPVRVQQILKEVIKLTRSAIPSNIEISHYLQSDCGLVIADPTQLHQIAMNLITNAFHAVEQTGGKISVRLREQHLKDDPNPTELLATGRYVVLSVADNGPGIPSTEMGKIFEPYFTTKEPGKGTGLGLAVVYGIVKEHQGDIVVTSQPGLETRFDVYLPLLEESQDVACDRTETSIAGGSERILLVDDDEAIAVLEQKMLERSGYRVTSKSGSREALEAFRQNPNAFDLVITDMTMPKMTGDQLARKLMEIRPDIPVIICTGFSERIDKDRAYSIGIRGFLMKPVVKSEMNQMVRKILDESKTKTQQ